MKSLPILWTSSYSNGIMPILLSILLFLATPSTYACTVFIVGKDASVDGSVMVTHSNDGEFTTDPRLVKIPARTHFDNQRPVYFSPEDYPRYVGTDRGAEPYYPQDGQKPFEPIGYIPQVNFTFDYLEDTYGAVNSQQLGIGESTCSGVFGAVPLGMPNGTALLSVDALTQLAMERASSAKQAIQIMGSLAEQYGFYGAGQFEGTAESLAVSDTEEAWIFHILPDPTGTSAIWAAQKVPSNGFAVLANMFVLRELDPNDTSNFLMSDSVHKVAQDYGWWNASQGLLDFTKVYSDGEYAHKYYSGRRMWGAYHLACNSQNYPADYGDLQSDPVYPVWCVPDSKLSHLDLMKFHRYTYQNTPYDLGAAGNVAAGPFGSPDRWKAGPAESATNGNWERPIGLYRTSDTYIVQSNAQSNLGAVLWYGPASALATVFTPFIVDMPEIPDSFSTGWQGEFRRDTSMFWAACVTHNVANLKWNYAIKDINKLQDALERNSTHLVLDQQAEYEKKHYMPIVYDALKKNADHIVKSWWSLSDQLLFAYASGFVNIPPDDMSQMVGYPKWWLEKVGYADGPPPPPTKPKCCHPPHHDDHSLLEEQPLPQQRLTGKAAMKEYLRTMHAQQQSSS